MMISRPRTERRGIRTDSWLPVGYVESESGEQEKQITCWKVGPFRLIRTITPRYVAAYVHPNPPEFRAEDSKVEAVWAGGTTQWLFEFKVEHNA